MVHDSWIIRSRSVCVLTSIMASSGIVPIVLALVYFTVFIQSTVSNDEQGLPLGHLKPLGGHRPPDPVEERHDVPSPEEFWDKYVKVHKAVVFRGAAKHSLAFSKWTDDYLIKNFPDLEVRLEAKKEKQGYIPVGDKGIGRDTIKNFINTYHTANKYIVSELPAPMYKDYTVIPSLSCGTFKHRIVEVDWWMNGGKASSIIHKDAFNQINCLMNGTKEWKLIEYKYENKIYKHWEPEREVGGFSRVNPEKVDLLKYPKVAEVPWSFTTIFAGDCLFLPGSMYHQVKSYGTHNVALSLLFSRFGEDLEPTFNSCKNDTNANKFIPLSEFDVDWPYPGTGTMTMGAADLRQIVGLLFEMIDRKGRFRLKRFERMFKHSWPEKDDEYIKNRAKKLHDFIVENVGEKLLPKDIMNISKTVLRRVALAFQPPDPSNTYEHEYAHVPPQEIVDLINRLVKKDGKLLRNKFVKHYKRYLYGTEKFANEIVDKLGGPEAETVMADQVEKNVPEAVSKYQKYQRDRPAPPDPKYERDSDAYDNERADAEMHETEGMPNMDDDEGMSDMGSDENEHTKDDTDEKSQTDSKHEEL